MKRNLAGFVSLFFLLYCGGCGGHTRVAATGLVSLSGMFKAIEVGGAPITLTATVSDDTNSQGVTWTLSAANASCSPACGALRPSPTLPGVSAIYTPPATVPVNQQATITARSNVNDQQVFAFNFQITAAITVSVAPKFSSQTSGGRVVDLTATITNDVTNAGLSWALNAGNAACSPQCGTLTVDPAPSLTAHYQPPPPSGTTASATITAASVADPGKTDSFTFTIVPPAISVTITNKFSSVTLGGASLTVNAALTNDFANAGVTWALTSTAGSCSPACGTLTPSPAPSLSAAYAPPAAVAAGATITATSVTDPTKSDSFSFTIVAPSSVFKGSYAFLLHGFDSAGNPMAMVGSVASDGFGNITGGELDLNDNATPTSFSGLSGSYTLDTTFNSIPRITINLASGPNAWVLKGALSSDGARGKVVEYDASLRLTAGTLLLQDPVALAAANPSGTYVFGLDSDAGTSTINGVTTKGRIAEAGQLIIGPVSPGSAAIGVTGGVADAGQSNAPAVLLGTGKTPATIAAAPATAPDAFGRGTFSLSISGNSNTYVYYVVNSSLLDLMENDSGGTFMTVQSGTAQVQKPLTADSVKTSASVAALSGTGIRQNVLSTNVIIGVLSVRPGPPGTTAPVASATFEFNNGGQVPNAQTPVTSGSGNVFSYDPATGRALLINTFFFAAVVYLSDTGAGYVIDVSPPANGPNHAYSGPLIPQGPGPFSLQSHVFGNSIGIAGGTSLTSLPNFDLAANFDSSGVWSSLIDFTSTDPNILNGQAQNVPVGGQFVLTDPAVGRGVISFPAGAFGDFDPADSPILASYYIIGPHQFVVIGQVTSGPGVAPSGVIFFDPD